MKKIIFSVICYFMLSAPFLNAKGLQAFLSYSTFYSSTTGPYIETYLSVVGNSVKWIKNDNNKFQATIQIIITFKKDSVISNFKKYNLSSPQIDDTANINFNFLDQQRFGLKNGTYDFQIALSDINNPEEKTLVNNSEININYPENQINLSGIELVESYKKSSEVNVLSKSGYDIVPYIFSYYPPEVNSLKYYTEIYNSVQPFGKDNKYLLASYIRSFESGLPLNDYYFSRKETASDVNVILSEFNISLLPTGNYYLVVEIKDRENKVITSNEVFFQRYNPTVITTISDLSTISVNNTFVSDFKNIDSLKEFINCLSPISTEIEKSYAESQLNKNDIIGMQQYFLYFWQTRNVNAPEAAWNEYYKNVQAVNSAFGTSIKKGYRTDRGRVYLQFGPPNSRQEVNYEPNAYPYEIWHYYTLGNNQRNKKFVFYNTTLAVGDYELLHSDAIGEKYDALWQRKLNRDNTLYNYDETGFESHWGSRVKDFYNNPR